MKKHILCLIVVLGAFSVFAVTKRGSGECTRVARTCDFGFFQGYLGCCVPLSSLPDATFADPDVNNVVPTGAACGNSWKYLLGYCIVPQYTGCGKVADFDCWP